MPDGSHIQNILLIGDSLIDDLAGSVGAVFQNRWPVVNLGVGGDRSPQIRFRLGALPVSLLVTGGEIPSSGSVPVAVQHDTQYSDFSNGAFDTSGVHYRGIMQNQSATEHNTSVAGMLLGVTGVLSKNNNQYTFTRKAPGMARQVPGLAQFSVLPRTQRELVVVWMGRNNYPETDIVRRDVSAVIDWCNAYGKPFVMLNIPSSRVAGGAEYPGQFGYQPILDVNQALLKLAPAQVIPIRELLVAQANRSLPEDAADFANGVPPNSLRRDDLHYNAAGLTFIAGVIRDKVTALYASLIE